MTTYAEASATGPDLLDGAPLEPQAAYDAALRGAPCRVVSTLGGMPLEVLRWQADADHGDEQLLRRCAGATVDIGCGPGRMTKALLSRGVAALGIDVAPEAVRQTRERGGVALNRDVFGDMPGEGRWSTALLADGNIGIGGDPVRLLRRVWRLLTESGRVVVDLSRPGGPVRIHELCLEIEGVRTNVFPWAVVPADQIALIAEAAAFEVLEVVDVGGRWFAELAKQAGAAPR